MAVICNVVATVQLNVTVDLEKLENALPMALHLSQRFSGLLIRVFSPRKAHAQVYTNGKMTVNGGRSVQEARELAFMFADMVREQGYAVCLIDYKIVNLVGSFDLQRRLPLEKISKGLSVLHEPELFSGLSMRLSCCTAVLFHSGKVNFLGARTEDELLASTCELIFFLADY